MSAFLQTIGEGRAWGQVFIRPGELRHVHDLSTSGDALEPVDIKDLRLLAQNDAQGQFRPLKSAPDLRPGWIAFWKEPSELLTALHSIYPNSVFDWYAIETGRAGVTHYREFTNRQTGMYRITTMLDDRQAGEVIRAGCLPNSCLKRRYWTVEGLDPDAPENKSGIPCLEPCAILLELARRAVRIQQEAPLGINMAPDDLETLLLASGQYSRRLAKEIPTGDLGNPLNGRRVQLVLEKYAAALANRKNKTPQE